MSREMTLEERVADFESVGAERRDAAIGRVQMPPGYALMLNSDRTHYYWLRADGRTSSIDWDKWRVYRGAKADAQTFTKV